jgi:hypothetical protein
VDPPGGWDPWGSRGPHGGDLDGTIEPGTTRPTGTGPNGSKATQKNKTVWPRFGSVPGKTAARRFALHTVSAYPMWCSPADFQVFMGPEGRALWYDATHYEDCDGSVHTLARLSKGRESLIFAKGMDLKTYYCHQCARELGLVTPADASAMTASGYLLEKYIKHTAPTGIYPVNSIFQSSDWQKYKSYALLTAASGCLEIDDQNRKNLIYFAGEKTGMRYDGGVFTCHCSGVKLVCAENVVRMHPFPSDFQPEAQQCANCGALVPFTPG